MSLVLVGKRDVRFRDHYLEGDPVTEYRVGTVEVWVDIDRLASTLGPRALTAKGRQAREASGAVVVTQVV
jgi:hypothetical protein